MGPRMIPRTNSPFLSKPSNLPSAFYGTLSCGHIQESFKGQKTAASRLFKALNSQGNLIEGMTLHAYAEILGIVADPLVATSIVSFYGRFGAILEAEHVFTADVKLLDVVLWNAMSSVYVKNGEGEKVFLLYRQMRRDNEMHPNVVTFMIGIQACGILATNRSEEKPHHENQCTSISYALEIGRALHSDALRDGVADDVRIVSTLINMYGKCHMVSEAEHVFSMMPPLRHNIVSWNAMLSTYVDEGRGDKVLLLYSRMAVQEGMEPDHLSIVFALRACGMLVTEKEEAVPAKAKVLMIGRALHMVSESMGLSGNAFLGTTLVNVYGKCGSIVDAEYAFQALSERTVVSWNSMLCAYIEHCQVEKALLLYRQMKESSCVDGDQHTLTFVIQACSALMEKAKSCRNERAYGVRAISELGQALHAEARKMAFFL